MGLAETLLIPMTFIVLMFHTQSQPTKCKSHHQGWTRCLDLSFIKLNSGIDAGSLKLAQFFSQWCKGRIRRTTHSKGNTHQVISGGAPDWANKAPGVIQRVTPTKGCSWHCPCTTSSVNPTPTALRPVLQMSASALNSSELAWTPEPHHACQMTQQILLVPLFQSPLCCTLVMKSRKSNCSKAPSDGIGLTMKGENTSLTSQIVTVIPQDPSS